MKDIQRLVTIVVGAIVLYFAYNFWFGSGIFAGWFEPKPPEGFTSLNEAVNLGDPQALRSAGSADLLSQGMEIILTILSTIGTVFLASIFKVIQWLSRPFESAANNYAARRPIVKTPSPPLKPVSSSSPHNREMGDEEFNTMLRVLGQSVIRKNKKMTIAVAEEMAGESYLTRDEGNAKIPTPKVGE